MFQIHKIAGEAPELDDDQCNHPGHQAGQQPVPALRVGPQAEGSADEKQKDGQFIEEGKRGAAAGWGDEGEEQPQPEADETNKPDRN